jgi:hypothetical protein
MEGWSDGVVRTGKADKQVKHLASIETARNATSHRRKLHIIRDAAASFPRLLLDPSSYLLSPIS